MTASDEPVVANIARYRLAQVQIPITTSFVKTDGGIMMTHLMIFH